MWPGAPSNWSAVQFHVHTHSEHTVNGIPMDVELHTVHTPSDAVISSDEFKYAAVGIMFDKTKYTVELSWSE